MHPLALTQPASRRIGSPEDDVEDLPLLRAAELSRPRSTNLADFKKDEDEISSFISVRPSCCVTRGFLRRCWLSVLPRPMLCADIG